MPALFQVRDTLGVKIRMGNRPRKVDALSIGRDGAAVFVAGRGNGSFPNHFDWRTGLCQSRPIRGRAKNSSGKKQNGTRLSYLHCESSRASTGMEKTLPRTL